MPKDLTITVDLKRVRAELEPIAVAADNAATAAAALLDFVPPELNPVVLTRDRVETLLAEAANLRDLIRGDDRCAQCGARGVRLVHEWGPPLCDGCAASTAQGDGGA